MQEFFDVAQRAYAAHVAEGNRLRAGFVAPRTGALKGLAEPVDVVTLEWR
jgi:hypothetical protein